jgi:hypothetical protein
MKIIFYQKIVFIYSNFSIIIISAIFKATTVIEIFMINSYLTLDFLKISIAIDFY